MAISYIDVGVYNTDGENDMTTFSAPVVSGVAFTAVGNVTNGAWDPGNFQVDNFSAGASVSTASGEQLYTTGNTTDVSNLIATYGTSYYSGLEDTFTWGGPGGGAYADQYESISAAQGLTVALQAPEWGLIRNAEIGITAADAATLGELNVVNYAVTNIQFNGAGTVVDAGSQNGTVDFSHSTGYDSLTLASAATTANGAGSTQVVLASQGGGVYGLAEAIYSPFLTATSDYAGNALTLDGSKTLVDFYDTKGGSTLDQSSNCAANAYLNCGNTATMSFITHSGGPDTVTMGSGSDVVAHYGATGTISVVTDENDTTSFVSFMHGQDKIDMALPSVAGFTVTTMASSTAFTDTGMHHGIVVSALSGQSSSFTTSVVSESGVYHLIIT